MIAGIATVKKRFVVEGLRELRQALQAKFELETLYYCPDFFSSQDHSNFIDQIRRKNTLPLIRMSKEAFSKATFREGPDGLIGVGQQQTHSLHDFNPGQASLLLILEGMEKPGNLGAILRSADGAGADGIILVDCILDPYNPNAIRSSQGLIFSRPIIHTEQAILAEWLKQKGIQTVAVTPGAETLHWNLCFRRPTALVFGSESDGLTDYWVNQADSQIRIPMSGHADSLNVAAAAAICLYEARRQRGTCPAEKLNFD